MTDSIIDKMESLDREMEAAFAGKQLDQLTILNQEFHRILYSVNPNQVAVPVLESVWLQLGPVQRQVVERVEEFYKIDRHKEILEALRSRDAA